MSSLGLTQISKTIVHHMTCGFVYLSIVESIMIIFKNVLYFVVNLCCSDDVKYP